PLSHSLSETALPYTSTTHLLSRGRLPPSWSLRAALPSKTTARGSCTLARQETHGASCSVPNLAHVGFAREASENRGPGLRALKGESRMRTQYLRATEFSKHEVEYRTPPELDSIRARLAAAPEGL